MTPQFSILVPTYNQAGYLGEALNSLREQSVEDWEAVVVNDGSTDRTPAVLEHYADLDQRIRVFSQPNGGTAAALNKALSEARGTWICWLSSDDLFTPDKLAVHQRWFERCPDARFFFTYFRLKIEASGESFERHGLWGPLPQRRYQCFGLLLRNFISGISVCVHRSVFQELGGFSPDLRYAQDYDRWLWISSRYPGVFIPEWTCVNRNHAAQGSEVFPEGCYYDTARAAIGFLNQIRLENMLPLCDLSHPDVAVDVLSEVLRIALNCDAFIYWLGATPALFLNCFKWISRYPDSGTRVALWQMTEERLAEALRAVPEGAFAHLCRVMWLAAAYKVSVPEEQSGDPVWAARQLYGDLMLAGDPRKCALERYFREFMSEELFQPDPCVAGRSIVVSCAPQDMAWVQYRAREWSRKGANVLILCDGEERLSYTEGVYVLRIPLDRIPNALPFSAFPIGLHTQAAPLPVWALHDQLIEEQSKKVCFPGLTISYSSSVWKKIRGNFPRVIRGQAKHVLNGIRKLSKFGPDKSTMRYLW